MDGAGKETTIPDVLADRYASPEMVALWSPEGKVRLERELWIAVLKAERELGLDIPPEAVAAYERAKDQVDLASIRARERVTKHDVKARIEEFCALAGYEHIHKGMTSRDLTENVEQLQILRSLLLLRDKAVACVALLAQRARELRDVVLPARTHNVPAQPTTVGRRLAMFGEELLLAIDHLAWLVEQYPLRGLKGPVGTQLDLLTLFDGARDKVRALELQVARFLGFGRVLEAPGQVYPRSLDVAAAGVLVQLGSGASNFARTLRLMAGLELASEGFAEGQVGSSAMPHKMNARSCERINSLFSVLRGYWTMLAGLAGDQWNEGDVSCSAARRVALPGMMLATDGILETFHWVLAQFTIFPAMIEAEWKRYAPFLATTTLLMEAVRRGAGREQAHAALQRAARAAAQALRAGHDPSTEFTNRLAESSDLRLDRAVIERVLRETENLVGRAGEQTDQFVARVQTYVERFPGSRAHAPRDIL